MTLKFKLGDQTIEMDEAQARHMRSELNRLFGDEPPAIEFVPSPWVPFFPPPTVVISAPSTWIAETWVTSFT